MTMATRKKNTKKTKKNVRETTRAPARKTVRAPVSPVREAARSELDQHAADELVLYIQNTSELSPDGPSGVGRSTLLNMLRKRSKGAYDPELAIKQFEYLTEEGAKQYNKEFGSDGKWNEMFSKATRREAARQLEAYFRTEADLGNYDRIDLRPGARETVREAPRKKKTAPTEWTTRNTQINTWFERDRSSVVLETLDGTPIVEWWDEAVEEAVEDGYLSPKDWHGSAVEYANTLGAQPVLSERGRVRQPALSERGRMREPRSMEASRIDELRAMLPRGYSVETYSPGDGVTRYRFFENAPPKQDYFGPDSGIHTALGYKAAVTFAQMLGPARRPKGRARESGTLNERPWVPPSMAAEGITPIMLEVLIYGIGEHADRRRVPAPGDSYIHDRDGYARLQEEGYIVRKHKTQGLSSLGDYYVLTDKGAALWARYRDEARRIATPASRAPKRGTREVNEAPRGRWDGSDANERAYNSVHNGLVNIIIDGPNERSPEILSKANRVLTDLNRQTPPKRNRIGHDVRINQLRRMIHAAEEVMSGRRAPTGDSARGPALREDFDFDADPKKDQRWIVVYDEDAIELMPGWTGGQSDPLYAISSSGGANYAWVIEDAIANLDKDIGRVKKLKGGKFQLGKGTFTKKEIDELHIIRDALQMALDEGGNA